MQRVRQCKISLHLTTSETEIKNQPLENFLSAMEHVGEYSEGTVVAANHSVRQKLKLLKLKCTYLM